jgi:sarcosine oxidase subunit beta
VAVRVGVVGGGAIGLASALHAARLGADVTVLEGRWIAAGSSGLSAGVYVRQYVEPLDVELRTRSVDEFLALERDGLLTLQRIGFLRLARDEATMAQFVRGAEVQRSFGVDDAEALDAAGVARVVPDLDVSAVTGGLWGPTDGYLDGPELCAAYQARAEALGARLHQRAPLVGASRDGDEVVLRTPELEVRCDVVINAAGAWAAQAGELLGAPVELVNERHAVCIGKLGRELGYTVPTVMDYRPGDAEPGLYFRQEGASQLIAGLHSNTMESAEGEDPDGYSRAVGAGFLEQVAEALEQRLPGLAGDLGLREGWAGLYPYSLDNDFLIGPAPEDERVVHAVGGGGVGVSTSPAIGLIAAEWAVHGEPRTIPAAARYRPEPARLRRAAAEGAQP